LVSSTPVGCWRRIGSELVSVAPPPLLVSPSGHEQAWQATGGCATLGDWLWASQCDLDLFGNHFSLVTSVDGGGLPARLETLRAEEVSVQGAGDRITKIAVNGTPVPLDLVWHERQHPRSGWPLGMPPLVAAAGIVSLVSIIDQYGVNFFSSPHPTGTLRNTLVDILPDELRQAAAAEFRAATADARPLVTGRSWEWTPHQVIDATSSMLERRRASVVEIARFFDVPADMIDGAVSGQSVTYANVSQRNLQLLVTSLGPVLTRRERVLSSALPRPRFVRFDQDAILRMDPSGRTTMQAAQVAGGLRTADEVRAVDGLPPLTPEQMDQITALASARAGRQQG